MGQIKTINVLFLFILTLGKSVKAQPSWWDRHKASISCERPGYFVNPSDCKSFFRCVDKSTWNKPLLQRYDFTCPSGMVFDPAVSVCTQPGPDGCARPWWPDKGNKGTSGETGSSRGPQNNFGRPAKEFTGDPLDSDFGGDPGKTNENGGSSGSKTEEEFPDLFDNNSPTENQFGRPSKDQSGDPLDSDFGGGSGPENKPGDGGSTGSNPQQAFTDLFQGNRGPGSSQGPARNPSSPDRDPLDFDFGSPPVESSTTQSPSASSQENTPGGNWWGSNTQSSSTQSPNDIQFDQSWTSPDKPANPPWLSRPRPANPQNNQNSLSESPWRPTGPWGAAAGTSPINDLSSSPPIPESPFRPQRPASWWDPPFPNAQPPPLRPPPPPVPANPRVGFDSWPIPPYPARYPSYQIVSYPTWPGPYSRGRNPSIIVVYSNSRK